MWTIINSADQNRRSRDKLENKRTASDVKNRKGVLQTAEEFSNLPKKELFWVTFLRAAKVWQCQLSKDSKMAATFYREMTNLTQISIKATRISNLSGNDVKLYPSWQCEMSKHPNMAVTCYLRNIKSDANVNQGRWNIKCQMWAEMTSNICCAVLEILSAQYFEM